MVCHTQSATSYRPSPSPARRPPARDLTVDDAIGLFLDSLVALGGREATILTQGHQLRRFFRPVLPEPLRILSTERVHQLIDALAAVQSRKTGAPLTTETLLSCRDTARRFTRWCAAQGRLSADPMGAMKRKTVARLHAEINQLRADLEALRQERDQAREQLRIAGGAR